MEKYIKTVLKISFLLTVLLSMQSCYTTRMVDHFVSAINDFNKEYIGKTKNYILENFPVPPTDIKRLDNQYETLYFERYRNQLVGYGRTKFHLKDGICYKIETNEYKLEKRQEKVSILSTLFE